MRAFARDRGRGETPQAAPKPPRFMAAMTDLVGLLLRSRAPGLRWRLSAALVLTFAGKAIGVGAPLLLGAAVNRLSAHGSPATGMAYGFVGLILGWAFLRFIAAAAPQARDALFQSVSLTAQRRAASEAFAHALSLSLDFHQTKRTGALSRTIDRGARSVDFLLRVLVFNLAPTVLELVLAAGVLWRAYDWPFAVTAVATVAIYGVFTFAISNWRIHHRRELNEADSEAASRAVDALMNYETVKSFGAEARAADSYDQALATYTSASVKATTSLAVLNAVQGLVMSVGLAVMALLAGYAASHGRMGPGDVTAVVLILVSLYQPLNILGFAYREIRQAFIDMEAMEVLRREKPQVADAPDAVDLPPADRRGASLVFEGVDFRHDARIAGLDDLNFSAEPGSTVAVVGPSGSGKTTLVRLALRLIDPQDGRVLLDGVDLRDVRQASLRTAVALVPQDVALFNDTLHANIGFAKPGAGEDEIAAAVEAAELAEFVASLPDGLETRVGERGLKLSGGERQRVGIARALIADPRLLILDEATSALDSRTEAAIQETLRRARAGRTTLVVAHRLSTIVDADEILVLKAGKVVERGRHAALVAKGGEYATLWKRQTREAAKA
jgi:ABC-type transport system involved in Fe-S cluster assembly fused permease/ATPase subunit